MNAEGDKVVASARSSTSPVDLVIRIGLLTLLAFWSLKIIGPFLTVALWSAIVTVGLYPLFSWLAKRLSSRRLAAMVITVLCLMIVIGPVTWLGLGLVGAAEFVAGQFDSKIFSIPLPSESVNDTKATLLEIAPSLRPLGGKLLEIAGTVVFQLLEFVASIVIAGFVYAPGPQLVDSLRAVLPRRRRRQATGDPALRQQGLGFDHLLSGTGRQSAALPGGYSRPRGSLRLTGPASGAS
jgi:predicted PurR-regulated permease PerM